MSWGENGKRKGREQNRKKDTLEIGGDFYVCYPEKD